MRTRKTPNADTFYAVLLVFRDVTLTEINFLSVKRRHFEHRGLIPEFVIEHDENKLVQSMSDGEIGS